MFELTENEMTELVANCDRLRQLKHSSINPMVFTEQGVAMLSSVLKLDELHQKKNEPLTPIGYKIKGKKK